VKNALRFFYELLFAYRDYLLNPIDALTVVLAGDCSFFFFPIGTCQQINNNPGETY
jgi:hypothetical protein